MLVDNTETSTGVREHIPFKLEPFGRLEDGSVQLVGVCDGLFDFEAAKGVVDSCMPPGMINEESRLPSCTQIGLLKQATAIQASTTLVVEREIQHMIREYNDLQLAMGMK